MVGMQLGCLNHALLSANSIERSGCDLAWWVANEIDPEMACFKENYNTLNNMMGSDGVVLKNIQTSVSVGVRYS